MSQTKLSKVPSLCQSVLANSRGKCFLLVLSQGILAAPFLGETLIGALWLYVLICTFASLVT